MAYRTVITGMGAISAAGADLVSFGRAICAGKQCFSRIDDPRLDHLSSKFAALIPESLLDGRIEPGFSGHDRIFALSVLALDEALRNAGLASKKLPSRTALLFATCSGPMLSIEQRYEQLAEGNSDTTTNAIFEREYHSTALHLARYFGIAGMVTTVATACSASTSAAGLGADLIRCGIVDMVIAGGADTFSPTTMAGFSGLKATCEEFCAPFSKPIGLNLGEGAAFVVLESLSHATGRGAPVTGEILGYGFSNDAYHCSAPDPIGKGASLAIRRALADAGVGCEMISYINAHGTGTEANDKSETKAIARVFGATAAQIPVSSTKSMTGHCLGAAGVLETVATLCAADRGVYPPTANYSLPREGCDLDYVADAGRLWSEPRIFLKNSFAFGGNNAAMVIAEKVSKEIEAPDRSQNETVCVTAMGLLSAAGIGHEVLAHAHAKCQELFAPEAFGEYGKIAVARIAHLDAREIDRRLNVRGMDRASYLSTLSTSLALAQAQFSDRPSARAELGYYMNLAHGSTWAESEHISLLLQENYRVSHVAAFPYIVPNSIAGSVCRALMLTGHTTTFCWGEGAGLQGIGMALAAIANGHVKAIAVGAVDEISEHAVLERLRAGADPGREIPSEAAATFVLETLSGARSRGVKPLATMSGFFWSTDTAEPNGGTENGCGLAQTIQDALAQAEISTDDVFAVCAMRQNPREMAAIKKMFGSRADSIIFDTTQMVGYAEACSSLLNFAAAVSNAEFGSEEGKKYILTIFSSPQGSNCAWIAQVAT